LRYAIKYSPETIGHLRALTARQRAIVFNAVEEQLRFEPLVQTRNRKLMRPNPLAPWELRIGELRVYYDVEGASDPTVVIHAIGIKDRNRVVIGDKEAEL
jgi:mRNA-degrading endonuclease RelE of RelBE toxin-antitoxin system